ncbi:uncharacterized protein B0H64DRAFT_5419 [Chaetomium fimeti]|uniref:Uncharacterized protein n=1 Tax=Chaetomium fimeti TaxID=1854472 RepID=A0AAE0HNY3_9PEZI|nr:hypothetical protein B0H64DRAFT_5419 [Chaetomium fimeti]
MPWTVGREQKTEFLRTTTAAVDPAATQPGRYFAEQGLGSDQASRMAMTRSKVRRNHPSVVTRHTALTSYPARTNRRNGLLSVIRASRSHGTSQIRCPRSTVPGFQVSVPILCSFGDSPGLRRRLKRDDSIGLEAGEEQLAFLFAQSRAAVVGGIFVRLMRGKATKGPESYPVCKPYGCDWPGRNRLVGDPHVLRWLVCLSRAYCCFWTPRYVPLPRGTRASCLIRVSI